MFTSAAIYRTAVLGSIGQSVAEVENRSCHGKVWDQGGDIRDVISIGKLVRKSDGPEEVEQILATIIKYGPNNYRGNSISGAGSEN
jgi:hypothetical protein